MHGNSRPISTNQSGPHPDLQRLLDRHRTAAFRKPIAEFNRAAFKDAMQSLARLSRPWILDSGCGTAESTARLARVFPEHSVLGVDRSQARLHRMRPDWPDNALLCRADLIDFWRLLAASHERPTRHYLLYPNPYPKKQQLGQRWHGHPVFTDLLACCTRLHVRSNWRLYLEEMQLALGEHNRASALQPVPDGSPLTAFERKYQASGQTVYQLVTPLP